MERNWRSAPGYLPSGSFISQPNCPIPRKEEWCALKLLNAARGTSIGANYREANRARSKADFRNKIKICETEASETQYWLEVIIDVGWFSREEVKADYDECSELLAIFTSAHSKSL
ncbi:MAG: four helix bundle protein [Calditrichaceae bacterium]|nr:four helix bundle protein [Calditrichaceae bacterium]